MINNILNAYEERRRQNRKNLLAALKQQGVGVKIQLFIVFVCEVIFIITIIQNRALISLIVFLVFSIILVVGGVVDRKTSQKKWKEKTKLYNEQLNMIKEILTEQNFNLYEKNKIRQLINKFKVDIENLEKKDTNRKENQKNFSNTYILPILAFAAGKLSEKITGKDLIVACFLIIILLVAVKLIMENIWILQIEIIEGNEIVRKRDFMVMLQDLLDRDFSIEKEDLI